MNIASAISGASINTSGSALQQAVSVRVASQTLDNARQQGDAAVALINSASATRGSISARPTLAETGQALDLVG